MPTVALQQPLDLTLRVMDVRRYARLHAALARAEQTEGADALTGFEEVWRMRSTIYGTGHQAADQAAEALSPEEIALRRAERELFD